LESSRKRILVGKIQTRTRFGCRRFKSDELLTERFFRPEDFDVLENAVAIAEEKGVSVAQLAISWLLHKGVTAPIVGVTKLEHVQEAVDAVELKLSEDDMARLEEPYKPHKVLGHA